MLWIKGFPLGPSANELYEPNVRRYRNAKGKVSVSVSGYRRSKKLDDYHKRCQLFQQMNSNFIKSVSENCKQWINEGHVLRVDTYHVFHVERVWTKAGKPQVIDANNRVKACLDAIATLLGIDDRYFFDGDCGKVTCNQKDSECAIIKISPMRPMTIETLNKMIEETSL